jgi:hypothetical protein
VALATELVGAPGEALVVLGVELIQQISWNLEGDGAVVELPARLEGIDVALQRGGEDEASVSHRCCWWVDWVSDQSSS